MSSLIDEIRHESQRGLILSILVDWQMEWMPLRELRAQMMRRLGDEVEESQVKFHLRYLEQNGYAEMKQLRAGRAEFDLTTVRATPRAVDLKEGRIAPDAGVAF